MQSDGSARAMPRHARSAKAGFALLALLALATSQADRACAATAPQPGRWTITIVRATPDGKKTESSQARCLTADQVDHLDRLFAAKAGPLAARCSGLTSR